MLINTRQDTWKITTVFRILVRLSNAAAIARSPFLFSAMNGARWEALDGSFQPPALCHLTWSDRDVWSLEPTPAAGASNCTAHTGADTASLTVRNWAFERKIGLAFDSTIGSSPLAEIPSSGSFSRLQGKKQRGLALVTRCSATPSISLI